MTLAAYFRPPYAETMSTLIIEHSDQTGADRLAVTLRDLGHRLQFARLHHGDSLPADLAEVDAIITCGGPQDPFDDSIEWMADELDLLRRADALQLPVVGICLGSQLLARALGGAVAKMPGGIEFGWHRVALNPIGREDPVFAGIGWETMQFEHHSCEVTELPPDARLLASSETCKVQVWARGLRTYGIQYHPEIHRERIDVWVDDEPEVLEQAGITREELARQTDEQWDTFARLGERLFEAIALLLMPVDRRHAGIAKDLHH